MRTIAQAWRAGRRDVPWFRDLQRLEDEQVWNSSPMEGLRAGSRPFITCTTLRTPLDPSKALARRRAQLRAALLGKDLGALLAEWRADEIARRNIARGLHIGLGRTWRQQSLFDFVSS
jgi:hypothetical protein